ncbi:hypothetical protein K402DRAFT_269131 [Aulographum hederae CBS 113979]|uniref:Uncharacterized protein n=1 Tax=Aulographum hederae CBS 113979 TaxID=1176131 RepID=A0A6G1H7W2_9PEZI|nr:hypothetical protein K402DRAFT_269131 [Aulographum hederae CBS 113979]
MVGAGVCVLYPHSLLASFVIHIIDVGVVARWVALVGNVSLVDSRQLRLIIWIGLRCGSGVGGADKSKKYQQFGLYLDTTNFLRGSSLSPGGMMKTVFDFIR